MTPQEAKNEWDKDDGQIMPCNLGKWYKNIGKSLRIKNNFPAFYKYETITKRKNKRYMMIRYDSYSDYLIGRSLRVEYSIVDTSYGCKAYMMNYASNTLYIYSSHCVKRYSQRWTKNSHNSECVHKLIKDNLDAKNMIPFVQDNQIIVRSNNGLFFGKMVAEDVCLFTTFVDNDQLFNNQLLTNEYIKDYCVEYIKEYRKFLEKL